MTSISTALLAPLLCAGLLLPGTLRGQEAPGRPASPAPESRGSGDHPTRVRVRQVSGGSVYLDVGSSHGLEPGDTIPVSRDLAGPVLGRLFVRGANEVRSVLATLDGLEVSAGGELVLHLRRPPAAPVPQRLASSGGTASPQPRDGPASPQLAPPRSVRPLLHGHAALDLSAARSVTSYGLPRSEVDRSFATPSLRVDAAAENVGGFRLRTSFRVAYRYSQPTVGIPTLSARVHHAALERTFTRLPLRLLLGRFHSPVESHSGFWDGVLLRYGASGLGGGAILGFQPDRWNERPSAQRPKATAFLDVDRRGTGWRWKGALSAHGADLGAEPSRGYFLGLDQQATLGRLRLAQQLRVDRSPLDGRWSLGWVELRGSIPLLSGVDLTLGASRRERDPWIESWDLLPALHRDRLHAGLGLRVARSSLGAGVSLNRDREGTVSRAYSGSFVVPLGGQGRGPLLGASASWWSGERGDAISASPSLSMDLARVRLRLGYRFYRFSDLERESTLQGGDISADVPLSPGLRASLALRKQWGPSLRNELFHVSLSRSF